MAFLEQRLPITVTVGSRGGPVAKRTKVYVQNGKLLQNFEWTRPLHRYDLSYGIKTLANFEAVRAMWYVVMFGPYEGFRIRDWSDYQATQANSRLDAYEESPPTEFQLQRVYTVGAASFRRNIYKLDGTPSVYRTRSGTTSLIAPTINLNTGIATIAGHLTGDTYTWVGNFDVPVTFSDDVLDQIEITGNANDLLQSLPSIKVEELHFA
jgi:uncharacterized protein (TIGR02217 family)